MGIVYKGEDTKLHSSIALWVLANVDIARV